MSWCTSLSVARFRLHKILPTMLPCFAQRIGQCAESSVGIRIPFYLCSLGNSTRTSSSRRSRPMVFRISLSRRSRQTATLTRHQGVTTRPFAQRLVGLFQNGSVENILEPSRSPATTSRRRRFGGVASSMMMIVLVTGISLLKRMPHLCQTRIAPVRRPG